MARARRARAGGLPRRAGASLSDERPRRADPPRAARPSARPTPGALESPRRMLTRDQVLHVARLARLELTEDEVERFAGELSKVLDHIETIDELDDLDGVEPTSHVVDVENALRADEPRPSLPHEVALAPRPTPRRAASACRARAPGATDERAARADRRAGGRARSARGELDAGELWTRLPRARGRRRPQRLHLGGRRRAARVERERAAGRRPRRRQGPLLHRGRPEPGRLEDPRGLPAALHGHRRRAPAGRRRAAARQDQPGRVRDGLLDRALRLRPDAEPVGPRARARRLVAAARPPPSPPARRRGRSAPTPAARSASPPRCAGSSG